VNGEFVSSSIFNPSQRVASQQQKKTARQLADSLFSNFRVFII